MGLASFVLDGAGWFFSAVCTVDLPNFTFLRISVLLNEVAVP